jgi:hypothetical protein
MQQIFDGRMKPITTKVAYIKGDINQIIEKFLEWQSPLAAEHKNSFEKIQVTNTLEKILLELCPLTTAERRKYLFIPTQSQWVAFFDNGHTGTDRTLPEVLSQLLNTDCIYVVCDIDTEETVIDIFGASNNNETNLVRSIAVIKESGWKFYQYGTPLHFEKQELYQARVIKNRFNRTILIEYLNQIGIDIYNETFYNSKKAVLLSKHGPKFENTKELTLQQAQVFFT